YLLQMFMHELTLFAYFFLCLLFYVVHLILHSFPTRRSSDLLGRLVDLHDSAELLVAALVGRAGQDEVRVVLDTHGAHFKERRMKDRKSTRLNSSHVKMSYAVFCLKKKMIRYIYCTVIRCGER